MLLLSFFEKKHNRISAQRSEIRNRFAATIADKILVSHTAASSKTEKLCREMLKMKKPVVTFNSSYNDNLIRSGALPIEVLPIEVQLP